MVVSLDELSCSGWQHERRSSEKVKYIRILKSNILACFSMIIGSHSKSLFMQYFKMIYNQALGVSLTSDKILLDLERCVIIYCGGFDLRWDLTGSVWNDCGGLSSGEIWQGLYEMTVGGWAQVRSEWVWSTMIYLCGFDLVWDPTGPWWTTR